MYKLSKLFNSTGVWNFSLGETVVIFLSVVFLIFLIIFVIKCFSSKKPVTIELEGETLVENKNVSKKTTKTKAAKAKTEEKQTIQPCPIAPNTNFNYNLRMVEQSNTQNIIPSEFFSYEKTDNQAPAQNQQPELILSKPVIEQIPAQKVNITSSLTQEEIAILEKCNIDVNILNGQCDAELLVIIKKIIKKYKKNEILARIEKIQNDINNLSEYISKVKSNNA